MPVNASSYRPREGYELHHFIEYWRYDYQLGYRPREGYELHPKNLIIWLDNQSKSYRPREGYELHPGEDTTEKIICEKLSSP